MQAEDENAVSLNPREAQMQAEEENAEAFIPQEDSRHPVSLPTEQESSTEPNILIPEAFLVDDIPSAEIVPTEKYSITIAGRKIHIGFSALVVLILISVVAGVVYATTANSKDNTPTTSGNTPTNYDTLDKNNTTTADNSVTLNEDTTVAGNSPEVVDRANVTADKEVNTLTEDARVENITNDLEHHVLAHNKLFNELPSEDVRTFALNWIIHDDPMKLSASDSNLHQRYILAILSFQYGLDSSKYRWLSEDSECFWYGVSCHDGKVNEITLREFLICVRTWHLLVSL